MQTFLPYTSYRECAKALDNKRLNKQILECYQILNILSGQSKSRAWAHHPAVLMWAGAENHLYDYTMTMVKEATLRGIKVGKNLDNLKALYNKCKSMWGDALPVWRKSKHKEHVHITHRVNLYHKDPIYYASFGQFVEDQYNTPCCEKCKYYWATHKEREAC